MYFFQEGAEKQAQLERALREKGAVEKELEKVFIRIFSKTTASYPALLLLRGQCGTDA